MAGKKKKIPVGRHRFVNKHREAARLTLRLSRFYFKLALLAFIAADVRVLQGPIATQPPAAPFSDFSANSCSLFFSSPLLANCVNNPLPPSVIRLSGVLISRKSQLGPLECQHEHI